MHVLITAGDETSAYRVFDALVDRFPGVDPLPAPAALPGLVVLSVPAPTREAGRRPVTAVAAPVRARKSRAARVGFRVARPCRGRQATLSAVSSMTNEVWSFDPSTPVNFTVTVCPAYALRLKLRWV